jgi:hypothetical protein
MWLRAEELDIFAQIVIYFLESCLFATFYHPYNSSLEQNISILFDCLDELTFFLELFSIVSKPLLLVIPIDCQLLAI